MIKNKWGRIINIGSVLGSMGEYKKTAYSAAKAGILGFSRSLALEVAQYGITVNTIAPGFIVTDMTDSVDNETRKRWLSLIPLGYTGKPCDVANVVSFLVSQDSHYITGETLHMNAGIFMP
jgi:3-oxoacyl-[acyl-carrier protein] reductase